MRVARDQRFVVPKRHSWNIFEQVVTVAYLKKNQISLEINCVEVSFLIILHAWELATFLGKQVTASDMVLNTSLNHRLSTYYYNTNVCKDPNDYRSSCAEVFCIKDVLCQSLFFNKVVGLRVYLKKWLWYRSFPVNFLKFLRTPHFIEHLWWLLL